MKNMKSISALITFTVCSAATAAHAGFINHTHFPSGQSSLNMVTSNGHDISVLSAGGNFAAKTVAGWSGVGVSGGSVSGEIDGNQAITFTFHVPVIVTSLTITKLYTAGNHGDIENEIARFITNHGDFFLEAAGATVGNWDGFGTLINESPAIEGHGGVWTVTGSNIFGDEPITTLTLMSGNPGNHSKYGDFSFHSLSYQLIPAPGSAVLLLGAGVIALRRRRA